MTHYISRKVYTPNERNEIHARKDVQLESDFIKLSTDTKLDNRHIIFNLNKLVFYDL